MLYRNQGREWAICLYKVKYIQHGEELEQYTHDKQWWIDFADRWEHTEIVEFIDVAATDEQLARLEEIKHIPDGFGYECSQYVEFGVFPEGINHPLKTLQTTKENEQQGVSISEREINEIMQGMQISDLEIQLLELQLGGI